MTDACALCGHLREYHPNDDNCFSALVFDCAVRCSCAVFISIPESAGVVGQEHFRLAALIRNYVPNDTARVRMIEQIERVLEARMRHTMETCARALEANVAPFTIKLEKP